MDIKLTVKELIKILEQYPQNVDVYYDNGRLYENITDVEYDEDERIVILK